MGPRFSRKDFVSDYLESAIEAAQAAGSLLRTHYGRPIDS